MKIMRTTQLFLCNLIILFTSLSHPIFSDTPSIEQKCVSEFSKVSSCLDFATGKASTPSTACCSTANDIKEKDPACMCYLIQQVHKGRPELKSLGVQEDKLLQLPSACKLANISMSECPKLLNLTPSSPDYAFFTNSTKATFTPATAIPSTGNGSLGCMHKPYLSFAAIITIAATIFINVFQQSS